jgi:ABC-type Fe3+ transport system permease subunit/sugar lactone lactonase YvrE
VHSIPVWLIVILCSGLPLAWVGWQIGTNPAVLTEAWPDAFRLKLLARTLSFNAVVAIIATGLGIPVGIVLGRGRGIIAKILWIALPVSLLLPSVTYAYGWSQFFRLLKALPEPASGLDVMRCIWSLATWLWPVPAAGVGIALRRMDTQLQLQAMLDGALWRVTLRELAGPLIAAMAICMVLAVQEFAVYEPTGISVVATEVRMVFETGAFSSVDNPITAPLGQGGGGQGEPADESAGLADQRARAAAAVATALPLLLVIALMSVAIFLPSRGLMTSDEIEVGPWPRVLDAPGVATIVAVAVVIIAVVVPTMSLIVSLKVRRSAGEVWAEFSPQVMGSIAIAAAAGVAALGMTILVAAKRISVPLALSLVTFLLGGQLIAIALIRIYNSPGLSWVYNAPPVMVMAYLARFGWIGLMAGRATWSPRWRGLRDLAAVDGAGPLRTASAVVWPIAWPLLVAAGVLVMALSLTEVPATLLLSPQRPPMLTPMLMTWVHMLRYDAMIEASLLLMLVAAVLGVVVAGLVMMANGRWKMANGNARPRARFLPILLLPFAIFHLTGCRDASQPKAIWCDTGTGPSQVVYPRAITYKKQDDTFFIVDRMARVQHLDHSGQFLNEWRMPQWTTGKPVGISVGPDGNVYVPDTHYQRVMVYSPDGQVLRQWGSNGTGPGQFIYPTDIAFDAKGNIFVSEYGDNDRIQVFSAEAKYLYTIGSFGRGDGEFMRPQSILIDGETLYVTDACNHRIQVFKTDGTFVRTIGSVGSELGHFRYPYGLEQDDRGHLIVCEFGNNRVQLIDKATGRGIKAWGSGGHEPGQLAYPWGVALDKRDRVVTVDAGNNRLQVFEF